MVTTDFLESLLGRGFANLSRRRRKQLATLLLVSVVLHVVGLLAFGGIVVWRGQRPAAPVFVVPPPLKTYEPRQLEHRVKLQQRQRSSSRPSLVPRLAALRPSQVTLPKLSLDPALIHSSFQPKFKAVSGTGLGVGMGTGYGIGGTGQGVTAFNFFGIRGRADRVALLVDVSVSMIEDERGGPAGFLRVTARIDEVVKKLDEATLFNLIVFADAASTWKSEMVIANPENKDEAKRFLGRFNRDGRYGLTHGNVQAATLGLPAVGGTTRLDLALTAAFLQGADTILVISDGEPRVEKDVDPQRQKDYREKLAQWEAKHANELQNAQWVERRVWVPGHDGKLKEGRPTGPAQEGRYVTRKVRATMPRGRPDPPPTEYWSVTDFLEHLARLNDTVYARKGRASPVIHCIGYQIDKKGGDFLRKLAHSYKGNYRRVASLR